MATMKPVSSITLPTRITYIFVLTITVVTVVFGVLLFVSLRSRSTADYTQRTLRDLQKLTHQIENGVAAITNSAQLIISDGNLVSYLSSSVGLSAEELIRFRETTLFYIENVINMNPGLSHLCILTDNPEVLSLRSVILYKPTLRDDPVICSLLESDRFSVWQIGSHNEGQYCGSTGDGLSVTYLARLQGYDPQAAGVVAVGMSLETFLNGTNKPEETEMLALLYRDGATLVPSDAQSHPLWGIVASHQAVLTDQITSDRGVFTLAMADPEVVVAYEYIDAIDAYALQIDSLKSLSRHIASLRMSLIAIISVAIIAFSLIMRTIVFRVMNRLQTITEALRHVEEGNWDVAIDTSGNDELTELAVRFKHMVDKINELIATVVAKQTATRNAQTRAFVSQINAHFMYNTLENIRMTAEIREQYQLADAVTALGRFLRYSINWNELFVPLREEIRHTTDYLQIVDLRRDEPVQFRCEVPEDLMDFPVPKMVLQPMVENSVVHGFAGNSYNNRIIVSALTNHNEVQILIRDNGNGIGTEQFKNLLNQLHEIRFRGGDESLQIATGAPGIDMEQGIGIANVQERISILYGVGYGVTVPDHGPDGTTVRITIPREAGYAVGFGRR